MSADPPPPEEKKSPKPRRRWLRWILVLLFLLISLTCFLFWANSRGIHWAVEKILNQQLEENQLSGSFQIEGTAQEGLSIRNLSLTGKSKIQRVQSDLIKIDWTPASLLKKKIDVFTIEKLHIVFDPLAPDLPEAEEKEEEGKPLSETLNFVRTLILPTEISITDLDLTIKNTANLTLDSFTHSAESDDYLITNLNTIDHLDRPVHNPSSTITWTEEGLAIDRFTLLPKLSIQNIVFHPEKMATGEIIIDGNQLTLTSDLVKAHHLTLDSPTLPIASLIEIVQPGVPAGGVITALEIDTSKGLLDFQGHNLKWEDQEITSASIEARTPDLLSPFDQPINLKIALADQLEVSGIINIDPEPLDSKAKLIFTLRDPRIPTVTGELAYADREAHVTATALDGLNLDARYFLDSNTYEAQASAKLKDASLLDENITGPLSFTFNGKGSIDDQTHSGTLDLTSLKLNQPDLPDAVTQGTITYDWPKKVAVKGLKITSKEGKIQANLNWQNDILTVSQLDLIEGTTKLFSATAQLPAPLTIQSLDDVLNSTDPISLTIKSQPLSFKKLSSFAPIPADLSGVVQADITLSGSLAQPTLNGFATLDTFRDASQPDLPPLDLELTFKTEDKKLLFTTIASEPLGLLFNLDGSAPFLPRVWLESETDPYHIPISLHVQSPNLDLARFTKGPAFPEQLSGILKTDLTLTGTLTNPTLDGFFSLDRFRLESQPDLPPLNLDLNFKTEDQKLLLNAKATEPNGPILLLDGTLPFLPLTWIEDQNDPFDIPLALHLQAPNLELARFTKSPAFPEQIFGTLKTDLTLTGTLTNPTLDGFFSLARCRVASQPDLPPLDLDLNFKTENQKLNLTAKATEPNGPILLLDGTLPFLPRTWIEGQNDPFDTPLALHLQSPNLDLARFTKGPTFPEQLSGTIKTNLTLAGTLTNPSLDGFFSLDRFRLATQPDLPPLNLDLNFKTKNQNLILTAKATEPGGPLLLLDGALPFLPRAWIERKTNPNDSPIRLRAYSPELDLKRIKPFAPMIQKITGSTKIDVAISGTISDPKYSGSFTANVPELRIAQSPIGSFRDTNLNVTFTDTTVTIQPSKIKAAGGTAIIKGNIDLAGPEPILDINLAGNHLLLHRTQDYSFRGNTDLNLRGPVSKANISGKLEITESLIYKDIEILPFGAATTSEIPRPTLPTFKQKAPEETAPTTETEIMGWGLNIDVTTVDPVLIRGNLARGEVSGNIKVTGTIGDPKTDGILTTKDVSADLPFSDLNIQSCSIHLRPDHLTNPTVNIRGSSVVGQYTVQVYVTGPVENPALTLTSDPPLPESEILILIATGSASSELGDSQVASQKALQFLLEGLRRRNKGRDKTLLQRLLKNSDEIQLSLGDTNQFSGRKFSSASLEINDQWDFTTQIDELGQTRALVVFSLRIR